MAEPLARRSRLRAFRHLRGEATWIFFEQNTYAFYDFDKAIKELENDWFNSTNNRFKNNEGIEEIFQILMLSEDLFEILNNEFNSSYASNFEELEKFKEFYFDNFVFEKDTLASVNFNAFKLKKETKLILTTMEKLFKIHS